MKLLLGLLLAISSSVYATSFVNSVVICAAACNNGTLDTITKTSASYGSLFFAKYNPANATNSATCLANATEVSVAGDRKNVSVPYGIKEQECSSIMLGKYAGRKVNLTLEKMPNKKDFILQVAPAL